MRLPCERMTWRAGPSVLRARVSQQISRCPSPLSLMGCVASLALSHLFSPTFQPQVFPVSFLFFAPVLRGQKSLCWFQILPLRAIAWRNPMDRGVFGATVHGVTKSWTWLRKGTSLMAQWLKLHAPSGGGPGLIPGQGTKSHMQQQRSKILHTSIKTPCSQINKIK